MVKFTILSEAAIREARHLELLAAKRELEAARLVIAEVRRMKARKSLNMINAMKNYDEVVESCHKPTHIE
jgi:hypothetical protein